MPLKRLLVWLFVVGIVGPPGALLAAEAAAKAEPAADFNRDVVPILSNNCFKCHGPDAGERKASLRLDVREVALKPAESGERAIVPGKPGESELVRRIFSADEDERMPPPASHKSLTEAQRQLLKQWIAQGAEYRQHWAYVAHQRPAQPALPRREPDALPRNPIDRFVQVRLQAHGLHPSAEADKVTLARRLYFDLTGLPPSPEQVDRFVRDTSPAAYEALVDSLLASEHYGERMAMYWLDLVRYADTSGYHSDNERQVWLYRDYVIGAFNANKPFDRFTIEQLAGDLMPDASRETRIGSGYNRMLLTTEEGGAQAKEYTAKYAADRVRNVASVWLGSTMACCECHDHKFDPFKARDFYSMAAFFADVQEEAIARQIETPMPTRAQAARQSELDGRIAEARKPLDTQTPELDAAQARWETSQRFLAILRNLFRPTGPTADLLRAPEAVCRRPDAVVVGPPDEIARIFAVNPLRRSAQQRQSLATYFRARAPELQPARDRVAKLEREKADLVKTFPLTLITTAVAPRTVRILPRGNWQDDSGDIVAPAVPAFLLPLEIKGRRANRLDLARWMVDRRNPLVARVFVNRLWRLMFGQGIVKTVADFGSQGTAPTHPELLDWLAVEFIDSGWDVKHVVKLMVTSAAYRQSSAADERLRDLDPDNRWLGRQGRFRLDAELVRDNALAISGLLSPKIGGPSVKPYQPAGYWAYLNFPPREWANDRGESQYRRGLYTFWQRTFLHPSLAAFDAPSREECTAARVPSNTPLQALVLLNDPTYVEAARVLAARMMNEGGEKPSERIDWAFHRALSRPATTDEIRVLAELFDKHLAQYRADGAAAGKLLGIGDAPLAAGDTAELAAWISVARAILNLHETITRS